MIARFFLLMLFFSPQLFAITPDEVVKKADEVRFYQGDVSFKTKAVDYKGNKAVSENVYKVYSRGSEASLVDTLFPEKSKGRKMLMLNEGLYIYTPDMKRPTRLGLQQKLTGEVSNGDVARTNMAGDYKAALLGEVTMDGKKAYHLKLKADSKNATYDTLEYWVEVDTFAPLRINYYALSGKLLKVGSFKKFESYLGKKRPTILEIINAVSKSQKSILHYSEHKKEKFSDSMFNKESLQ